MQSKQEVNSLPITDLRRSTFRILTTPVGSVLVYGGRGAGHVEIRTDDGFVSDFKSNKPSKRPLIGVYIKPS